MKKYRINPHKPLSYYLDKYNKRNIVLPKDILEEDILIITHLFNKGYKICENVGKYKDGEIYLCYLDINKRKYLYGIIEIYPHKIEYHTFDNNIRKIELNSKTYTKNHVLNDLSDKLHNYFIEHSDQ